MLTLSFRPSTIVGKNAITTLSASVLSKAPARMAQIVPLPTVASNPGKAMAEDAQRWGSADLGKPETERFEKVVGRWPHPGRFVFGFAAFQHLLAEKSHVDHPDAAPARRL